MTTLALVPPVPEPGSPSPAFIREMAGIARSLGWTPEFIRQTGHRDALAPVADALEAGTVT